MKTVSVRDLQMTVRDCVDRSQREGVVVTRHGHPAAILIGVEGKDWETVLLEADPAFWRLIQRRRRQRARPLRTVKRRLGLQPGRSHRASRKGRADPPTGIPPATAAPPRAWPA